MRIENGTLIFEAEDLGIGKAKTYTIEEMYEFARFYALNKVDEWLGIRKEMLANDYDGDEFKFNEDHPLCSEDFSGEMLELVDINDDDYLLDQFLDSNAEMIANGE